RCVVALHQLHVGEGAVTVDVHLLVPRGSRPGVVGVVVGHHVAASGGVEEDGLVHPPHDVVLHQVVRRAAPQDNSVAIGAETVIGGVVDEAVTHHTAVGPGEGDVHPADGPVGLHVLDPAVGGVGDVDSPGHRSVVAGVAPALNAQVLNPRPLGGHRPGGPGDLGQVGAGGRELPVQR